MAPEKFGLGTSFARWEAEKAGQSDSAFAQVRHQG
jgi:hypothetical protein